MSQLYKRSIVLTACFVVATLTGGFLLYHEFYVSLTDIRYNPDSKRLEVSMRIFPDDMDRALELHSGFKTHLVTKLEPPAADSVLHYYLLEHFHLEVNGKEIELAYLGKEPEDNVMWCYLESEMVETPVNISVRNPILTEVFEDQVNIIQSYVGYWNRGLLLSGGNPEGTLTVGE